MLEEYCVNAVYRRKLIKVYACKLLLVELHTSRVFFLTRVFVHTKLYTYMSIDSRVLSRQRRLRSDTARTAAPGLLPLLVRQPGTVFRNLSATRTPPKLLSGAC